MLIEIIVIFGPQGRKPRDGIDNLLVLLIGGIPIAMPTVLSVTMAIGSHRLSQQVYEVPVLFYIFQKLMNSRTFFLEFSFFLGCNHQKDDSNRGNGWHGRSLQ